MLVVIPSAVFMLTWAGGAGPRDSLKLVGTPGGMEGGSLAIPGGRNTLALPRVYQLERCGVEIKEFPDISVADGNHTENLCLGELLHFFK